MKNPTVSLVIPAYQSAATLAEALDSAAAQSSPVHEIIVVDDASPDTTTADVFDKWVKTRTQHAAIARYIRQAHNTGPAGARNTGIRAATGDWVAFLDGDDAWLPGKIEAQLNTAATHASAVLLSGRTIGLIPGDTPPAPSPVFRVAPLRLDNFINHNPVATSTVMVRRRVLLDIGLFDEQFRGPEDYDLWLRIASEHECLHMDTPLTRYRTTAGSLSMDDRTFLPQVLRVLQKAFSEGGALQTHRKHRHRAYAEQYSSASWMAYNRGDCRKALRHLLRSWCYSLSPIHKERTHDRLLRLKLLLLYLHLKAPPSASAPPVS